MWVWPFTGSDKIITSLYHLVIVFDGNKYIYVAKPDDTA